MHSIHSQRLVVEPSTFHRKNIPEVWTQRRALRRFILLKKEDAIIEFYDFDGQFCTTHQDCLLSRFLSFYAQNLLGRKFHCNFFIYNNFA